VKEQGDCEKDGDNEEGRMTMTRGRRMRMRTMCPALLKGL